MSRPRPSRITPEVLEREAQVLKLRRVGLTFDMIATQLGYSHASGAHKAYANACKRIIAADVIEIRAVECDRLDIAQTAIWSKVLGGDSQAINNLIRIMERRARLLGLDMPTRTQIEVGTLGSDSIDSEVARLAALLDSGTPYPMDAAPSEA